jgi:molybdenum cofactor synthesis domain-containing protein
MAAMASGLVRAAMLIIGNEILSGRTRDANLGVFAARLAARGIEFGEVRIVADIEAAIVDAVNALRVRYDLVFTTGGIGPTHDDITADSIAKAFGVAIGESAEALALLQAHYKTPAELTPGRRRMARIPAGASLIPNAVSTAPGFRLGNVYVMAGIPRIAETMLEAVLESLPRGQVRGALTIKARVSEGRIAEALRALQARYPEVEIGSYPSYSAGDFHTALVLKSPDPARLAACKAEILGLLAREGAEAEELVERI